MAFGAVLVARIHVAGEREVGDLIEPFVEGGAADFELLQSHIFFFRGYAQPEHFPEYECAIAVFVARWDKVGL